MRVIVLLLILICASAPAFATIQPAERMERADLDARAQRLYKEMRCVVCQSQSLADSPTEMAAAQRALVRERLLAGDSDDAIRAQMRALYGDAVLMKPPLRLATIILWFMPLLILLGGGFLAWRMMRKAHP